jgi:hypothetical protein
MSTDRKPDWIRPSVAAEMLGVARGTVVYRAGQGRYRAKVEPATGVTLVRREDVERDIPAEAAVQEQATEQAVA